MLRALMHHHRLAAAQVVHTQLYKHKLHAKQLLAGWPLHPHHHSHPSPRHHRPTHRSTAIRHISCRVQHSTPATGPGPLGASILTDLPTPTPSP